VFLKPKTGALVRDPTTLQPLPESGREVAPTSYWQRRLTAGDVVLVNSDSISDAESP
jgi:hypothetical protein